MSAVGRSCIPVQSTNDRKSANLLHRRAFPASSGKVSSLAKDFSGHVGQLRPQSHYPPKKNIQDTMLGTSTTTTADGITIIRTEKRRDLTKTIVEERTVTEPDEKVVERVVKIPHKVRL